jgi:hypothetical protein
VGRKQLSLSSPLAIEESVLRMELGYYEGKEEGGKIVKKSMCS